MSEERKNNNNKEIAKIRSWGQKETTFQQQKNQKDKQQQGIEIIIETTIIKPEDQVQKLNPIHPSWPNSSKISERGTSMFTRSFSDKMFHNKRESSTSGSLLFFLSRCWIRHQKHVKLIMTNCSSTEKYCGTLQNVVLMKFSRIRESCICCCRKRGSEKQSHTE